MGLFDFLRPKWKSKRAEVRLTAVRAMGAGDLDVLKMVAAGDVDIQVQRAAIERIGDRKALEELLGNALGPDLLREVRAKVDRLLCEEALGGSEPPGIEAALGRIDDLGLVERLATKAPTPLLRLQAVERINDPEALCRIVETTCGKEPARVALAKIAEEPLLARITRTGASKVTRRVAAEKLAAFEAERARPAKEERRRLELDSLTDQAKALSASQDWDATARCFAALGEAWRSLDPDLAHPRRGEFEGARKLFGERREEAARRAAEAKRQAEPPVIKPTPVDPESAVPARSSEVLGVEADHSDRLAGELKGAAARSSEDPERTRRETAELERRARAEEEGRNRREAAERRRELCTELEGLVDADDRGTAGRRVKELRKDWKELPAAPEAEMRALEERFRTAGDRFAVNQAAFLEQQEWLRWNNKMLKEELCAVVESLDTEEDLAVLADNVKEAQRRWKEIGPAPKAEADVLWERFKSACDRSFERCKPYLDELEQRRTASLALREELCRQAEVHVDSTAWKESADALKLLQAQWKEVGPIPRKQGEELYARFRRACDGFFERRQAHFAQLDEGRQGVQAEKERLCERAEALAAEPDRRYVRDFRDLQATWKRLGPAPRDVEPALWERFRGSCDQFFAWLDAGRQENFRKKEALCEEIEALMTKAGDADSHEIAEKIAEIQARWNEIGPVPRDQEDAIWDRFHKPCDEFFSARSAPSPKASPEP